MAETRKAEVVFFSGDDAPPVPPGALNTMIVTVEWGAKPGRPFTFAAYYLNSYLLEFEDGGCGKEGCKTCADESGDGCAVTGWFELKSHAYYDDAYFQLLGPNDRVIEWAFLPPAPERAPE
jgi:hypothetical protein